MICRVALRLTPLLRARGKCGRIRIPCRGIQTLGKPPATSFFLADSLVPKCLSCGIRLQTTDPQAPGFFHKPKPGTGAKTSAVRDVDLVFEKHVSSLDECDKKLLLNGADSTTPSARLVATAEASRRRKQDEDASRVRCLRCCNAQFRSQFDPAEFQVDSVQQVMQQIPPDGNLVYVLSSVDFPMSINNEVFRYWPVHRITFVVTKVDLLFRSNNLASKYGLQFFRDYLHRTYKVAPENVHVVSGKDDWSTERLLEKVRHNTFFIGGANSGKSTLLQSLVYEANKQRGKLPNLRRERDVQKAQGLIFPGQRSYAAAHNRQHELARFRREHGPGVSFMPGFTRDVLPLQLSKSVTVFDVPGFANPASTQLYEFLAPGDIRELLKGVHFHKRGTYTATYETAKAGQVITVGGLFFLPVPPGCMYRVRNMVNHKVHVFSSMEKAMQVWVDPKDSRAVDGLFIVDPHKTRLEKYRVPPFRGSFDLVLRNLGFVNVTATGTMPDPGTAPDIYVYLPAGMGAISRLPIGQFISRTLSGRDKRGNPLRKEKWTRLSTKEVKRYTGKVPLCREIEPIENVGKERSTEEKPQAV